MPRYIEYAILGHYSSGWVVGVAEPAKGCTGLFLLVAEHATGVVVLGECGVDDMICLQMTHGLRNEVDGIGSTACHHHLIGIDSVFTGYHLFQRLGRRLGVGTYAVDVAAQVLLQCREVGMWIYV